MSLQKTLLRFGMSFVLTYVSLFCTEYPPPTSLPPVSRVPSSSTLPPDVQSVHPTHATPNLGLESPCCPQSPPPLLPLSPIHQPGFRPRPLASQPISASPQSRPLSPGQQDENSGRPCGGGESVGGGGECRVEGGGGGGVVREEAYKDVNDLVLT